MKGRSYPPEFKINVVKAVLDNQKSVAQLCREHNISDSLIHTWKKLYREKGETAFKAVTQAHSPKEPLTAEQQELLALRNKVAELERFCGQMALENSILKKAQELLKQNARP